MSATARRLQGLSSRTATMVRIHESGLASWPEMQSWTDDELRHVARAVAAVEDAVSAVRRRHSGPPAAHV